MNNGWHPNVKRREKRMNKKLIFILTVGVFSIINTEMGVVGILPMIAERYQVSISTAGLLTEKGL